MTVERDGISGELGFLAQSDPRWQLVERILKTEPFLRSKRHQLLLQFMVDRSLAGKVEDLTERHIGHMVFSKDEDYAPVEDSTVRVQVRQLRFKLHEYFSSEGKHELLILDIPKGSYIPQFKTAEAAPESLYETTTQTPSIARVAPAADSPNKATLWRAWALALVALSVLLLGALGFVLYRSHASASANEAAAQPIPWPLSCVLDKNSRVRIVVADANYGIFRAATGETYTLAQYLNTSKGLQFPFQNMGPNGRGLAEYLSTSNLTSLADIMVATNFASIAAEHRINLSIRSQRDLQPRDFDFENHILLGSPSTNLWDTLFQDQLNFTLMDNLGHSSNGQFYFENHAPQPGEKNEYSGTPGTGVEGDELADIAMLPTTQEHGRILILQGLHQAGTEAAGNFLTSPANQTLLQKALGWTGTACPDGFEVLIRTRVVRGDPRATQIVASRTLQ